MARWGHLRSWVGACASFTRLLRLLCPSGCINRCGSVGAARCLSRPAHRLLPFSLLGFSWVVLGTETCGCRAKFGTVVFI